MSRPGNQARWAEKRQAELHLVRRNTKWLYASTRTDGTPSEHTQNQSAQSLEPYLTK